MKKEDFKYVFDVLNQEYKANYKRISEYYEKLDEILNNMKNTNFADLYSGEISIFPFGDFLTNTYCKASYIDFYVIYKTNKDNVNFSVIYEKRNSKGKVKKANTYQRIMGDALNKGVIQAEEIAERIAFNLKSTLSINQRIYFKRNEIYVKLENGIIARITVVYDCNFENNDLLKRRINQWNYINPLKYFNNIDKKNENTNNNFSKFVLLFKVLELQLLVNEVSNLYLGKNYFVENLLYNVPDELFNFNDDEAIMNNIINYLMHKNLDEFEMIDETGKMFTDKLIYQKNYAKQFINKIIYANEHFDEII